MRGVNFLHSFGLVIYAQSNNNYIRFPAIGDWGGSDYIIFPDGNTFAQEFGAASMDRLCGEKECDFLLSLGDNFYTYGVTDVEDTRFHFTYELVYGKASEREVLKTLDFYQCLGNHDHKDNATAQVSVFKLLFFIFEVIYSNLMHTTFKLPELWYSFTIEKETFSMKMIMIDTMVMMNSRDTHQLPGYPERDYRAEQNAWLEEELANCDADYCLVSGHHPVYSVSTHGPTSALVETLQVFKNSSFFYENKS
ncbi:unnamed protein product [Oikopleura dioica]|uniref:Calcineurin-like phosphoesterase domain-containing protein n=1 Tax=Oikopleura dioica TaxID=34765 RepID=E4YBS9_OIKDI|nr:unnamed protein product [Oikopleura dioica]